MHAESNMPDPHPGRCGCRSFNPSTGQYERCLGYADKPHICTWEKAPMPKPATSITRKTVEYPHWKSPLDNEDSNDS